MDRLKALSVFKAVVDNGSFVGAASALEISCPAVTRMVQELETLLGVRLLHRTTRRLCLTPVGEDVLERVCELLRSYDELASIGHLNASLPSGVIRLAAPAAFGRHYLGAALASYRALYPRVQVELQLCEGPIGLVSEQVDLALCVREELRASQIVRPLASVDMGVYAAPTYLARKGDPIDPAELPNHDCLTSGTTRAGATWSFARHIGVQPSPVTVRSALHANHLDVLCDAAVHGAGIVMLPAFMAQAAVAQGHLRRIFADWCVPPLDLQLAYNSRRNQLMSVRKLIDHLVDTLGGECAIRSVRPGPPLSAGPANMCFELAAA
jgi:DNA-binding transcriptional LysR family regulator